MKRSHICCAIIFISLVLFSSFQNFTQLLILIRAGQKCGPTQNEVWSPNYFHQEALIISTKKIDLEFIKSTEISIISSLKSKESQFNQTERSRYIPKRGPVVAAIDRSTFKSDDKCRKFGDLISQALLRYVQREGDEELSKLIRPLFTRRKLVIWTSDHHSAPVLDLRSLLEPLGVEFIDHTLYHNCDYYCHCSGITDISVLNNVNVLKLDPQLMANFQKIYSPEHPEISRVDAFASFFCFSQFEMFRPYNKSIIAIAVMRFETCRTPRRWSELIGNLKELIGKPYNIIGANNQYDREYIRYFTNINAHLLPSFSLYTGNARYNPTQQTYLFSAQRFGLDGGLDQLWNCEFGDRYLNLSSKFRLVHLRSVYGFGMYEYKDLASHLGIVHVPYQVSTMSIFEQYRMCIPLFFPSHKLFVEWNMRYRVAYDRTTAMKWGFLNASDIPPHPSQSDTPDPNDEGNAKAHEYWLRLADYYTLPHITHFSSVGQLVEILHHMNRERLLDVSAAMSDFNRSQLKQLLRFWRSHLLAIARYSPNKPT